MTRYITTFVTAASLLLLTAFTPITVPASEGGRDGYIPGSESVATDDITGPDPAPAACPTDVTGPADVASYDAQYAQYPLKTVAEWLSDKDFMNDVGMPGDMTMMTYKIGFAYEAATDTYIAYLYDNAGCLFNVISGNAPATVAAWSDGK